MKAYRLKKKLPELPRDCVFVFDNCKTGLGGSITGVLILAWDNGNCQGGWCGGAYILPGQIRHNPKYFDEIINPPSSLDPTKFRYHVTLSTHTCTSVTIT